MQFKRAQRGQLQRNWHGGSWFHKNLGPPVRSIIERAYGIEECEPKDRTKAQEDVTVALALFARSVGCEKSHVVHALLSGSIKALQRAVHKAGGNVTEDLLRSAWQNAFRNINTGGTL
jgi:hypothetical protein